MWHDRDADYHYSGKQYIDVSNKHVYNLNLHNVSVKYISILK